MLDVRETPVRHAEGGADAEPSNDHFDYLPLPCALPMRWAAWGGMGEAEKRHTTGTQLARLPDAQATLVRCEAC